MWAKDVGREAGAGKPLLKTIFQVQDRSAARALLCSVTTYIGPLGFLLSKALLPESPPAICSRKVIMSLVCCGKSTLLRVSGCRST